MNKHTSKGLLKTDKACAIASAVNAGLCILSLAAFGIAVSTAQSIEAIAAAQYLGGLSLCLGAAAMTTSHITFCAIEKLKAGHKNNKISSDKETAAKELI